MDPELQGAIIESINITLDLGVLVALAAGEEGIGLAEVAAYGTSIGVDLTVMMAEGTLQAANSPAQVNSASSLTLGGPAVSPIGSQVPTAAPPQ